MNQNQSAAAKPHAPVTLTGLRFEHHPQAFGIGEERPRLSWIVETDQPGWRQSAYEVAAYEVAAYDAAAFDAGAYDPNGQPVAQTGRVDSDQSVLVDWPFAPLASRQRLAVRVRVWGTEGAPSAWSEAAPVEAGLLHAQDWTAHFISPDWEEDADGAEGAPSVPQPSPMLRREFSVRAPVAQARLYITALGVYEAQLNGSPVGDHVMDPGWTSYSHRLRYQTFDVTDLLREGPNALGAMLGEGWFRGRLGYGGGRRNIYGDRLALLAQLEITYRDGTSERVITDESWRAAAGPILSSEIYDGETYDARLERPGWSSAGDSGADWQPVRPLAWDLNTLVAPLGPPVRRTQVIAPAAILTSPSGRTIIDFGQNLVGRLRIAVQGPAGHTITLRHAEVLENGELSTRPLRAAKATDRYTLKGQGLETYEPHFTFHGFRYAEIDNWPGELRREDVNAIVCHSDLQRTGWFECSDLLLSRLHENVVWSMRGNFFDIPTDCPQRDERLGWTGDIQVFSPTASYLFDVSGFLTSWLRDLAAEQKDYGAPPFVVPNTLPAATPPTAAWGDAAVFIPWVLYQRFGDRQILAEQFESMRAWVDLLDRTAGEDHLWDTGFQFGDWLDPAAPPENPGKARTPGFLVATAYFARSAELVGLAAGVLGDKACEARYLTLARDVRAAFNREYVTPAGRLLSDSSTAYALALQFHLLPDEAQRRKAGQRLASLARAGGYRISTGFVGTPLISDALCDAGYPDAAFRLLMTREDPSWLYPVTMGATTIWERWDSLLPDGSVNPGEMTSFNHYALGAVADWLHRAIGGLAPAAPGYRRLEIAPRPGGGLTSASAKHLTPYGMASCAWKIEGGQIKVAVEVPPNTTATVTLPQYAGEQPQEVGPGRHAWTYPYADRQGKRAPLTVESTVAELIDDAAALPKVLAAINHYGTELTDRIMEQENLSIREAVAFTPQSKEIVERIAEVLEK